MTIRSGRTGEDTKKISFNWDQIFGKKGHSIIVDELQEPEAGIYPYEMQRKMAEHLYKFKEEPTAEQKQEFAKMLNTTYGL